MNTVEPATYYRNRFATTAIAILIPLAAVTLAASTFTVPPGGTRIILWGTAAYLAVLSAIAVRLFSRVRRQQPTPPRSCGAARRETPHP